ncbi:helix-turn-helix domain-containing protein [Streptomyces brevispora]|uniref:helix-turn-helix domain-containing protein n=1 Tax=Streptomyces brevispora TaxID=887462 RepID=UPI0037F6554A
MDLDGKYLTTPEAARRLGIAPATMRRSEGRGPAYVRVGGTVVYREDVITRAVKGRDAR